MGNVIKIVACELNNCQVAQTCLRSGRGAKKYKIEIKGVNQFQHLIRNSVYKNKIEPDCNIGYK